MTASLADFQRNTLERLLDPACPRLAAVRTPVQSGIRRVIETVVRSIAATDRVLVLTRSRVEAEQWQHRLSVHEDLTPALLLDSADTALDLLEHPDDRRGKVLIATYFRAMQGPTRLALSELDFGLILYDDPTIVAEQRLRSLNERAKRVIAITSLDSPHIPGWPVVVEITTADLEAAVGRPLVLEVPFTTSQTETSLQLAADRLLGESGGKFTDEIEASEQRSIASLHAALLDIVAHLEGSRETQIPDNAEERQRLLSQAWSLVERVETMEDTPEVHSRLQALDQVLENELATGSRCVVIALRLADISYIGTHLASIGRPPVAVVASHTNVDRVTVLKSLEPGQCIVAGGGIALYLDKITTPFTVILWSSGGAGQRVVDRVGGAEGVRILQLAQVASMP